MPIGLRSIQQKRLKVRKHPTSKLGACCPANSPNFAVSTLSFFQFLCVCNIHYGKKNFTETYDEAEDVCQELSQIESSVSETPPKRRKISNKKYLTDEYEKNKKEKKKKGKDIESPIG